MAPNIYYLGYSGVVWFGGLRIGGVSGIFNPYHYHLGHCERLPFQYNMITSAYHVRSFEVFRLKQVGECEGSGLALYPVPISIPTFVRRKVRIEIGTGYKTRIG